MDREPASSSGRKDRVRYDAVLKDLFQRDHPVLLDRFTRGVPIRAALNTEFLAVDERRPDLVCLMANDDILHLEFQSANHPRMVYRMGRYCAMIADRYPNRTIHQVVLYAGERRMHMVSRAELGLTTPEFELHDIREFDSNELLRVGRRGDFALALLAAGGERNLPRILLRAARLPPAQRSKLLTQLAVLGGLRKLESKVRIEVNKMGSAIYIKDHAFLREIQEDALKEGIAKGKAEGEAKGKAEGMATLLDGMLRSKFGSVPRWAQQRLRDATPAKLERWASKALVADTLEGVIGPRPSTRK